MPENIARLRSDLTRSGLRLMLAVVLALGMTVVASMTTQQSAHAAGCAVGSNGFFPAATCFNVELAHKCEIIGLLANGNEADVCVDIHTSFTPSSFEIWGTGEYYCQGNSTQCQGIHANNILGVGGGAPTPNLPYQCSTTTCPNGGRAMVSTPHFSQTLVGNTCVFPLAAVRAAAAILVNGTSTAFHPRSDLVASVSACYTL